MRQNGAKENLIKPLILSVVVTLLGIGLLVYYVCFSKKPSTLNYVVSGLTVAVGISLIAAAIVRLVKVKGNEKIKLIGKSALGTFISYGTQKTSGKVAVYYIEYFFEDEGKKYVCKTPHEFNWYEVLTLKVVGDFPIKVYNGKSVLDCDIMKMHLDNREAVAELNAKYEQAIDELSQDK